MSAAYGDDPKSACRGFVEDLVVHLYGEASAARGEEIEHHVSSCAACRQELGSMRETLRVIDGADLGRMVAAWSRRHPPASWEQIRPRLEGPAPVESRPARPPLSPWLKAAAVVILAGGSFLAGTRFPTVSGMAGWPWSESPIATTPHDAGQPVPSDPADPDSRLRDFARRTDGYLNRSRFVLLEVSNAEDGSRSESLREVTRRLLRESREARDVAGQIADPRIEEVVERLESILREIARLADWEDASSVGRLRDKVNTSGMIEQLELLIPEPSGAGGKRANT